MLEVDARRARAAARDRAARRVGRRAAGAARARATRAAPARRRSRHRQRRDRAGGEARAPARARSPRRAQRGALAVARAQRRRGSAWPSRSSRRRGGTALAGRPTTFDLVVGNPPYIAADDPHLAALRHEPLAALTPGGDGLAAARDRRRRAGASRAGRLAAGRARLRPGRRGARAARASAGFGDVETRRDLAGLERATGGRRAPPNRSVTSRHRPSQGPIRRYRERPRRPGGNQARCGVRPTPFRHASS